MSRRSLPWLKSLCLIGSTLLALSACEVPDAPTGVPSASPDVMPGGPACYQELECVVDTTRDNTLRRNAQEAINTLILSEQPDYNRICQAKAEELTAALPQCKQENSGSQP